MSGTGPVPIRDRRIFHFTHLDNLPIVIQTGYLSCDKDARQKCRREVGNPEIKEARRRRSVPINPGGQVGDYAPFYFAARSPMMFRIACDHRDAVVGTYADGDRPLVYLVATVGSVVDADLQWIGTDGNAATATTEFTNDADRLDQMVDWPLMTALYWNNTPGDPDRQRRRMAELLIYRQMPISVIRQVGTFSDRYAHDVRAVLHGHTLGEHVLVRPQWYYGYERRR